MSSTIVLYSRWKSWFGQRVRGHCCDENTETPALGWGEFSAYTHPQSHPLPGTGPPCSPARPTALHFTCRRTQRELKHTLGPQWKQTVLQMSHSVAYSTVQPVRQLNKVQSYQIDSLALTSASTGDAKNKTYQCIVGKTTLPRQCCHCVLLAKHHQPTSFSCELPIT